MKQSLLISIFTLSLTQPVWASDRDNRVRDHERSGAATPQVWNNSVNGSLVPNNLVQGVNSGNLNNNHVNNTNTFTPTNTNTFNPTNTNSNTNLNRNNNTNTLNSVNTNTNTARSSARSTATGGTGGNAQVTVNNSTSGNTQSVPSDITIRNTPAVAPPAIYGTNNCALGVSAGMSVPGLGIGGGFSYESLNCEIRAQAALAHTTGQQDVAQEVMCELTAYRQARLRVARPCVQDQLVVPVVRTVPQTVQVVSVRTPAAPQMPRSNAPAFCHVPGLNLSSYPECN